MFFFALSSTVMLLIVAAQYKVPRSESRFCFDSSKEQDDFWVNFCYMCNTIVQLYLGRPNTDHQSFKHTFKHTFKFMSQASATDIMVSFCSSSITAHRSKTALSLDSWFAQFSGQYRVTLNYATLALHYILLQVLLQILLQILLKIVRLHVRHLLRLAHEMP